MRRITTALLGATALSIACAPAVFAADMPLKAPGPVVQSGSFYVWADGSYQSISLPPYDLGVRLQAPGQGVVPANTFDPRATGYGVSGGMGFVLPSGMALSNIGTHARIEFSGSYVNATASQTDSTTAAVSSQHGLALLNGVTPFAGGCGGGPAGCTVSGALGTGYSSWQANGKFATDYQMNGVTFTPSLAVFGGMSRNAQTLSETKLFFNGFYDQYNASTAVNWADWGGRIGLSGSAPVTDWLTFVASGNAGLAARSVSLVGSDSGFGFAGFIVGATSSSIALSQSTTAFVANAETSFIVRLAPSWSLRAFAGLNYDDKVPGVSAPGSFFPFGQGGTSTAAGVKYQAETSYYAGGGLTVKF